MQGLGLRAQGSGFRVWEIEVQEFGSLVVQGFI